jgi:predicted permease
VVLSLYRVLHVDLGFTEQGLVAVRIDAPRNDPHYADVLLERVRSLPGVKAAGVTDCIPIERDRSWGIRPYVNGVADGSRTTGAHVRLVSPGLVPAMGIPIVTGRDFSSADLSTTPLVVILNQTLAAQFWPGESAVGHDVVVGRDSRAQVIAVVADVRHSGPEVPSGGEMYLNLAQVPDSTSWDLMVRTNLAPAALAAELRAGLRDIDPTLPIAKVRSMSDVMAQSISSRRLLTALIGGFAAIAVLLAVIGLFGVISYAVAQQRREFAIRLALGAVPRALTAAVVTRTLRLAAVGVVIGLVLALTTSQLLRTLLFGLSPLTLTPYITAAALLFACAAMASFLPATRAGRVDPLEMLREE